MSVQIVNQNVVNQLSSEKRELLKRTICKGADDNDLELFIHACNRTGLDPFMKQIYAVFRNDYKTGKPVMTIQTGIDGYRLLAEKTHKYMPGRETTFTYDKDGNLNSATAYVKKMGHDNQWHEIAHTVHWKEYVPLTKEGKIVGMWSSKGHVMLGKCAEAAVLRKAFPANMSGVYTKEEMEQGEIETISVISSEISAQICKISAENAAILENETTTNIDPIDDKWRKAVLDHYKVSSFADLDAHTFDVVFNRLQKKITLLKEEELKAIESV